MQKTILETITAYDIADKGRAVGKNGEKTIFIEGAVPGDVVNVTLLKKSKSFDEGVVDSIIQPSAYRQEPFCQHFGLCGGCKWQHMTYAAQIHFKEKQVHDAVQRLAKISDTSYNPVSGCDPDVFYRNKMEYTFTNKRYLLKDEMNDPEAKQMNGLGLHIPGKFNKVLHIETCFLQNKRADSIRKMVYDFAVAAIKKEFPWLTSLQYIINSKRNDTIQDQDPVVYHGRPFIIEQLENLKFIISPKSFFQTNTKQALQLYKMTRDLAGLTGNEIVYDLYTGTGSIAAFVSHQCKKVIGVEYVEDAIADAKYNAQLNGIENMQFFAGDMKDVFTTNFIAQHGKPDVIITDPPRAGMHEAVIQRILESGARKVVYVSCNPATQARDLLLMSEKYEVQKIQPVDMFPHTAHVENIALLTLKN
ncbi:MAG: 23S rRNA (uracil(1939)-C(5))-methyltransferase RlmD [Bacteroidetes bacterium]|nr:23S rRNA (uracil(1939)-C(5))-methyltransferase RlmD [Bacteroidota bacterium]